MSKAKRLEAEREEHRQTLKKIRRITAIATISVILVIAVVITAGLTAYNARINNGEYLRGKLAASSRNIDVNGSVMSYFYGDIYHTFTDYYGSYLEYFGLDTSISLKDQELSDGESWFEYFMSAAESTVTTVLTLNEAAKDDGVTLTEAEKAAIKKRADSTVASLYGRGVNSDDIYNARLLEALAYKYRIIKEADLTPSEAEITAYFAEDPKQFQTVDYYSFSLYYDTEGTADDPEGYTEADIIAIAEELAASENEKAFIEAIEALMRSDGSDISEDDMTAKLQSLKTIGAKWSDGSEVSEWAFSANVGDTLSVHDAENTMYTVYMLTAEPYRSESDTVTVRHILLSDTTYGSREGASAKAKELLSQIKNEGMDSDDFALLVLEYSEDQGSYYSGGMYKNITQGQMVDTFDEWCFDPDRRAGDTDIIETDLGVHVMLFESAGSEEWQADVAEHIISERFDAYLEAVSMQYTVIFDDTVLDMIPG
ncbi:MAG: peptidylprolyl isomerase [Clostridia bacterium]|nr:peptidylprolyl isomerase [Clostridia bacterium]